MPAGPLARRSRPRTAPTREDGEPVPSFCPPAAARQSGDHSAVAAEADEDNNDAFLPRSQSDVPAARRFSANTLLDQSAQIGVKIFRQRRPSTSAVVPTHSRTASSSSDQRFGQWNSWLPHSAVAAKAEGIKHFVADRKASVTSVVRKVRARHGSGSHNLHDSDQSPSGREGSRAADDIEYICDDSDEEMLEGFVPVCPPSIQKAPPRRPAPLPPKLVTAPTRSAARAEQALSIQRHSLDGRESPEEPPSPSDAEYAFYTPRGSIANNTSWIGELSAAPTSLFDPVDPARLCPKSSKPRRRSWLDGLGPDSASKGIAEKEARRPSAPVALARPNFPPTPCQANPATMIDGADQAWGIRSRQSSNTPVIVTSSSDADLRPVTLPDEPRARVPERHSSKAILQADPAPPQSSAAPIYSQVVQCEHQMDDYKTLQLRIIQLEKELQVAQQNAEMWRFKYTALANTQEAQNQALEKLRMTIHAVDNSAQADLPRPPPTPRNRERKARRLSSSQTPKASAKVVSPALPSAELEHSHEAPVTARPDAREALVVKQQAGDDATFADAEEDATATPVLSTQQRDEPSTEVGGMPSHHMLSVSDHLDHLASAPNEGIDAATLNSLMPEESAIRRRRGLSHSAASGLSNMAEGLKAKLRTSPSSGSQPLPSLPHKSPRRPNMKLFGRRPSNLPSSANSINGGPSSPLPLNSPYSGDEESLFGQPAPMTHSRRSSRVIELSSLLPQRQGSNDGRPGSSAGRQRSASVTSKLSLSSLSTATRLVTATLHKNNALRLTGTGVGSGDSYSPAGRQITPSMVGPPLAFSPQPIEASLQEAAEITPGRKSMAEMGPQPAPPDWLESIAFEASDSEEESVGARAGVSGSAVDGASSAAAQRASLSKEDGSTAGMSSAIASSMVLDRFADTAMQASASHSSAQHTKDMPTPLIGQDAGRAGAILVEKARPVTLEQSEETNSLHLLRPAPSTSTLSTAGACHHGMRGEQDAAKRPSFDDAERHSLRSASSSNAIRAPSLHGKSSIKPRSSFSSRREATGTPDSAKHAAESRAFQRPLHLQPESAQNSGALISTRSSTRSQSSLRNRPPLTNALLSGSTSPGSRSSSKMGSHEVRVSMPHSPAPPSPSPSPSPPLASRDGDGPAESSETFDKHGQSTSVAEAQLLLPNAASVATPARSNPLKKLYKQALLTKKSAPLMKIPSPELPSLSPSGPAVSQEVKKTPSIGNLKDSAGKDKKLPAAQPGALEEDVGDSSVHSDRALHEAHYPQSLAVQFDWLQASLAFGDDTAQHLASSAQSKSAAKAAVSSSLPLGPAAASAQRSPSKRKSFDPELSLVDVDGLEPSILAMNGIGLGIDNVFADEVVRPAVGGGSHNGSNGPAPKMALPPPPLPPKGAPMVKYAHITPPSSDAE
ncbi:hypothetical protein OC835_001389 [Tilletia horrida]|nr:hypothetical protein OC835_001389 [Tilletia horrida]